MAADGAEEARLVLKLGDVEGRPRLEDVLLLHLAAAERRLLSG